MKSILEIRKSYENSGPIREMLLLTLRESIISGTIKSGERLKEESLSELFKVSRTPVREALKQLENEGLMVNKPQIGLIVTVLSIQDTIDLYNVK